LKALGVLPGICDLILVHEGRFYGLEMKPLKGGVVSDAQHSAHARLQRAGGKTAIARGAEEACLILIEWSLLRPEGLRRRSSQVKPTGHHNTHSTD
jgi:hypothetical protein